VEKERKNMMINLSDDMILVINMLLSNNSDQRLRAMRSGKVDGIEAVRLFEDLAIVVNIRDPRIREATAKVFPRDLRGQVIRVNKAQLERMKENGEV
jgi:hypothetical protein